MFDNICAALIALGAMVLAPSLARSEILAMMNYETKNAKNSLKSLKAPVPPAERREGIAIIDVDPASPAFGKIVTDIPLPADLVAHHIFYNEDLHQGLYHGARQVRAPCHRHEEAALYARSGSGFPAARCLRTSCSPRTTRHFT